MLNRLLMLFEETTTQTNNTDWVTYVLIGGMLVVFVLLMVLPGRKQKKKEKEMQDSIKVGSWVITAGGIIGEIIELSSENFTIVTGNDDSKTTMRFVRQAIYQVMPTPPNSDKKEEQPVYNEIR